VEAVQLFFVAAAGGFEAACGNADGFGKTPTEALDALALKLNPPTVEASTEDAAAAPEAAQAPPEVSA
jgi:hypothetical protein